jgi:hypothetical protein
MPNIMPTRARYGGAVTWLTDPADEWDDDTEPPRSHMKLIVAIVAGWLFVSLLVLIGLVLFKGSSSHDKKASQSPTAIAKSTATGTGTSQPTTAALPDGWVQQAADDQTSCAAHSYGRVKDFFAKTPCKSVQRVLATTNQGGRPVIVASSIVSFASATQARQYLELVTSDGTGNINDLLREGKTVAGVGHKLPDAAFASQQDGVRVLVAEAAYTDGKSDNTDATLKALAERAIRTP